jgi:hypothetical protein
LLAIMMGTYKCHLVKISLLQTCFAMSWKQLNDHLPLENNKNKKWKAREIMGDATTLLSYEIQKKMHG